MLTAPAAWCSLVLVMLGSSVRYAWSDDGKRAAAFVQRIESKQDDRVHSMAAALAEASLGAVLIIRMEPALQRQPGEVAELGRALQELSGLHDSDVHVVSKDTLVMQVPAGGLSEGEAKDILLQHSSVYQVEFLGGEVFRRAGSTRPYTDLRREVLLQARALGRQRLKDRLKERVKSLFHGRHKAKKAALPATARKGPREGRRRRRRRNRPVRDAAGEAAIAGSLGFEDGGEEPARGGGQEL